MTRNRRQSPHARLVALLAYALRHHPDDFGVTLDAHGWTDFTTLIERIGSRLPQLHTPHMEQVAAAVRERWNDRFELADGRMRARYGHSVPGVTTAQPATPPARLFHGTTEQAWASIQVDGLQPVGRCLVHLTSDLGYACRVAGREGREPCVLGIEARQAHFAGVVFYQATRHVWQTSGVPVAFLTVALALSANSNGVGAP